MSVASYIRVLMMLALGVGLADEAAGQVEPDSTTRIVEILRAGRQEQEIVDGQTIRRMIGNVLLRQDTTDLSAARVIEIGDLYRFERDVVIVDAADSLFADLVRYQKNTKTGEAEGNVRISDGEAVLTAPSGFYNVDEKRARFEESVQLVDSTSTLTSLKGTYQLDDKIADFFDEVVLEQEDLRMEADSLRHDREAEQSFARGRVLIEQRDTTRADSTTRTFLFGTTARHDAKANRSRIEGNPQLVRFRRDSSQTDTLLIRADHLVAVRTDTLERLTATGSVQVWQRDLAAVADSAVYDKLRRASVDSLEELRLFQNPVLWFRQIQVSGDSVRIRLRDGEVDSLFVNGNAFVVQEDTVLARLQQLKGRRLRGVFERDSLRTLFVGPNAEALYFRGKEDSTGVADATQFSSDRIAFYFKGGEAETMKAFCDVSGCIQGGVYQDDIPATLALQGLNWQPELRPRKESLFPVDDRLDQLLARLVVLP